MAHVWKFHMLTEYAIFIQNRIYLWIRTYHTVHKMDMMSFFEGCGDAVLRMNVGRKLGHTR